MSEDKLCRYRLTRTSYIDGVHYPVADDGPPVFVEYAGNPGTNMEPTDDVGRGRQDAYFAKRETTRAEAQERARREAIISIGGIAPGYVAVHQSAAAPPPPTRARGG